MCRKGEGQRESEARIIAFSLANREKFCFHLCVLSGWHHRYHSKNIAGTSNPTAACYDRTMSCTLYVICRCIRAHHSLSLSRTHTEGQTHAHTI